MHVQPDMLLRFCASTKRQVPHPILKNSQDHALREEIDEKSRTRPERRLWDRLRHVLLGQFPSQWCDLRAVPAPPLAIEHFTKWLPCLFLSPRPGERGYPPLFGPMADIPLSLPSIKLAERFGPILAPA